METKTTIVDAMNSYFDISERNRQEKHFNLNDKQIITLQQAYNWSKLEEPKYICFGNLPLTKEGKEFFAPFLQAGYIHKDTLKYTGVFRLTDKGKQKFEELLSNL